jgi:hypothetical protein
MYSSIPFSRHFCRKKIVFIELVLLKFNAILKIIIISINSLLSFKGYADGNNILSNIIILDYQGLIFLEIRGLGCICFGFS